MTMHRRFFASLLILLVGAAASGCRDTPLAADVNTNVAPVANAGDYADPRLQWFAGRGEARWQPIQRSRWHDRNLPLAERGGCRTAAWGVTARTRTTSCRRR